MYTREHGRYGERLGYLQNAIALLVEAQAIKVEVDGFRPINPMDKSRIKHNGRPVHTLTLLDRDAVLAALNLSR